MLHFIISYIYYNTYGVVLVVSAWGGSPGFKVHQYYPGDLERFQKEIMSGVELEIYCGI